MKMMNQHTLLYLLCISLCLANSAHIKSSDKEPKPLDITTSDVITTTLEDCITGNACTGTPLPVSVQGTICMPVTGNQYEKDMDCQWRISAPIGYVVKLEFIMMDIEECEACACDYVSLYDGPDMKTDPLDKVCGSQNKKFYSKYQNLFLHFFSDHTVNAAGFRANVTFIPVPRVAFHAVRVNPKDAPLIPIHLDFEGTTINEGGDFNLETSQFICSVPGPYYFSISAGAVTRKQVNMILRLNGSRYISALRTSASHDNIDMISRSVIIELQEGDVVDVEIDSYTSVHSDDAMQTSITGFLLPFLNENTAAVFAARTNNRTGTGTIANIEKRLVEINDWGTSTQNFYNPYEGQYYAEISVCLSESRSFRLYLSGAYRLTGYSGDLGLGVLDTQSQGGLEAMDSGDYWYMYGGPSFTNNELQTSILSFPISKDDRCNPHFRADRTSSLSTPGPISFNDLVVNDTIDFDMDTGTFTCIIPGTYFVRVGVATQYSSGVSYEAVVDIMKNDQRIAALVRLVTNQPFVSTLSRSLLVNMAAGDTLRLHLSIGQLYSSSFRNINFSSFLLFESDEFLKAQQHNTTQT